jgi:hypothetical protein
VNSAKLELYLDVPHVGVDGVHNGGQNIEVEVWGAASLCSEGGHIFIKLFSGLLIHNIWFLDPHGIDCTLLLGLLDLHPDP